MTKRLMALTAALVLGIIVGVGATGLVYAYSGPEDVTSLFSQTEGSMMADHHSTDYREDCEQNETMPEECVDYDSHHGPGGADFDHHFHHGGMH